MAQSYECDFHVAVSLTQQAPSGLQHCTKGLAYPIPPMHHPSNRSCAWHPVPIHGACCG